MIHVAENIWSAARTMPGRSLLSPEEFFCIWRHAQRVDKTLSRLTQEDKLMGWTVVPEWEALRNV